MESAIITQLREKLEHSENAEEMFRVFTQYNAFLVRPRVQAAIETFQTHLVCKVCTTVSTLGYLSFGPIEKYYVFCDLSVRVKRRQRER